jgi:LacI family transcriptional regulator
LSSDEKKAATIRDVAARAGVAVATASRALSGSGYSSSDVRKRVRRAARELGYKPHALARSLRMQRTNTVGLLIGDIVNPFYAYLADGVLDRAMRSGYHVILCAHGENPATEREYLEVLIQQRVDGIVAVVTGENLDLLHEAAALGTELVFVDREPEGFPNTDVVVVDNAKGSHDMTSYLIGLGHRRIGAAIGPPELTTGGERLRGYQDALRDAGIPGDPELVQILTHERQSAVEAANRLLSLADAPSAVFAYNNTVGRAVLAAVRERGMSVPDDISLAVFDDVPWTRLTSPAITVVAQPDYRLGYLGMDRLADRLSATADDTPAGRRDVLQPHLEIRESCAPVARDPSLAAVEPGHTSAD